MKKNQRFRRKPSRFSHEPPSEKKFKVSAKEQGKTLLAFLRDHDHGAPSIKGLKKWIELKRCTVNKRLETFSTHRLKAHDEVILTPLYEKISTIKPVLLWEDEWLKAYDKPAGMLSEDVDFKARLVHRLDKDTSGVLLFAKTELVLEQMIEIFRQKKIHKTYLAIVDGIVKEEEGFITSCLAPKFKYEGGAIYGSSAKGATAQTQWHKIRSGQKASLVKCHPITGKTHQIRVHLKEMHHPILGDHQYANFFHCSYKPLRHLLHAYSLQFMHPVAKEEVAITASLPSDFVEALSVLGLGQEGELFSE